MASVPDWITTRSRHRWQWVSAVERLPGPRAGGVSPAFKLVLGRLARHYDPKTEQCNPSEVTLAKETHMTKRGVQKMLKVAQLRGMIARELPADGLGLRRGHGYRYRLRFEWIDGAERANSNSSLSDEKRANETTQKGECGGGEGRTAGHPKKSEYTNAKRSRGEAIEVKGDDHLSDWLAKMLGANGPAILQTLYVIDSGQPYFALVEKARLNRLTEQDLTEARLRYLGAVPISERRRVGSRRV